MNLFIYLFIFTQPIFSTRTEKVTEITNTSHVALTMLLFSNLIPEQLYKCTLIVSTSLLFSLHLFFFPFVTIDVIIRYEQFC